MSADIIAFKGSTTGKIVQSVIPSPTLKGAQVLVEIHHSGFCGTDLHYLHRDMVIGHEGAGIVKELGPGTRYLKIGDRVGFGWYHDSCGRCEDCLVGDGAHCRVDLHSFGTHELDQGGFATHAVWKEDFLYPIPDGMSTEIAAPLMCAGMTVFTPLIRYAVKPTDRVGVVGIGALGHLAIQFASKMGCDVVAFSGTESKKEEALALGARSFVVTKGQDELKLDGKLINHLLVTTSAFPDWKQYIALMAPFGTIYPLTVQFDMLSVPHIPFLVKDLSIRGSTGGSRLIFQRMLEFSVFHNIKPMIEKFPFSLNGIEEARAKMQRGEVRYKVVLEQINYVG